MRQAVVILPLALFISACSNNAITNWSCKQLKADQAVRQACLDQPSCALTVRDMKQYKDTAASIAKYCSN
jgi:hypothetical protein